MLICSWNFDSRFFNFSDRFVNLTDKQRNTTPCDSSEKVLDEFVDVYLKLEQPNPNLWTAVSANNLKEKHEEASVFRLLRYYEYPKIFPQFFGSFFKLVANFCRISDLRFKIFSYFLPKFFSDFLNSLPISSRSASNFVGTDLKFFNIICRILQGAPWEPDTLCHYNFRTNCRRSFFFFVTKIQGGPKLTPEFQTFILICKIPQKININIKKYLR